MATITNRTQWLVVDNGQLVSAHVRPEAAKAAAARVNGSVGTKPVPASISLAIGQRVRLDRGMVLPA